LTRCFVVWIVGNPRNESLKRVGHLSRRGVREVITRMKGTKERNRQGAGRKVGGRTGGGATG